MPYHAYKGHTTNTFHSYIAHAYAGNAHCSNPPNFAGQHPASFQDCINSGADPQCCLSAAAHHNPGAGNQTCGMKGYYVNNCCNCGQPECGGGNTYPTGSVKPGQAGYNCLGSGGAAAGGTGTGTTTGTGTGTGTGTTTTTTTPADTGAAAGGGGGGSSNILATLKQNWIIVAAALLVLILLMKR